MIFQSFTWNSCGLRLSRWNFLRTQPLEFLRNFSKKVQRRIILLNFFQFKICQWWIIDMFVINNAKCRWRLVYRCDTWYMNPMCPELRVLNWKQPTDARSDRGLQLPLVVCPMLSHTRAYYLLYIYVEKFSLSVSLALSTFVLITMRGENCLNKFSYLVFRCIRWELPSR